MNPLLFIDRPCRHYQLAFIVEVVVSPTGAT
jgi:hypothetical protein